MNYHYSNFRDARLIDAVLSCLITLQPQLSSTLLSPIVHLMHRRVLCYSKKLSVFQQLRSIFVGKGLPLVVSFVYLPKVGDEASEALNWKKSSGVALSQRSSAERALGSHILLSYRFNTSIPPACRV